MKDKTMKASQILADKIQPLLFLIDSFVEELNDNDYELLEEAKEVLRKHISMQHSAATLTLAFGMEVDTLDEEYKLKSLDQLIEFLKLRKEYRESMIKQMEEKKQKEENCRELMRIFENL